MKCLKTVRDVRLSLCRVAAFLKRQLLSVAVFAASAASAGTYHVAPGGSDDADGTAANPFKTFARAFETCTRGDVVEAADGTYTFTSAATVPLGVTVRSARGDRDACILDGGNATPIFETPATASAMNIVIAGFTFRNARNSVTGTSSEMESGGGAIRFTSPMNDASSASVISNCVFQNCHSDTGYGGALMIPGGTTVSHCFFTNCTAMMKGEDATAAGKGARGGGAIYAVAKTANIPIRHTVFFDCGASNGVGVVNGGYYHGADTICARGKIDPNHVAYPSFSPSSVTIHGCAFSNCWSYGSTVCLNYKVRTVSDTVFYGSVAKPSVLKSGTKKEPAATVWQPETIGITQYHNQDNLSWSIQFRNCVFEKNETRASAKTVAAPGCIYFHSEIFAYLEIENCTFKDNSANGVAAGGYVIALNGVKAGLMMQDSVFTGNVSPRTGSTSCHSVISVAADSREKKVVRCRFENNKSNSGYGGVLYMNGASDYETSIIDCVFKGNTWSSRDGAIPFQGVVHIYCANNQYGNVKNLTIRNCLFAENKNTYSNSGGRRGSMICLGTSDTASQSGPISIENCTFANNSNTSTSTANSGDRTGRGVIALPKSSGTYKAVVRNCVFVNNKAANVRMPSVTSGQTANGGYSTAEADVTYNIEDGTNLKPSVSTTVEKTDAETGAVTSETIVTDLHNITGVKVTFDADALAQGNYIPKKGVWVNSGFLSSWMPAARDLYGNARVRQGAVDRGCAEGYYQYGNVLILR